jgi:hypothetical protein
MKLQNTPDLAEFKEIILNKIQKAQLDLDLIKVYE